MSCSFARRSVLVGSLLLSACVSDADADPPPDTPEMLVLHEVATQVTVARWGELMRLDGQSVAAGVESSLLLNSDLVRGGELVGEGIGSKVEGGETIGTMHGVCITTGGGLTLEPAGDPGSVAKCEQALNLFGEGQIVVSGLIQQQAFEAGVPQTLAVVGGTGEYRGATGQLVVTQLTFPGIVKRLELTLD